jgi:hypothetical protein
MSLATVSLAALLSIMVGSAVADTPSTKAAALPLIPTNDSSAVVTLDAHAPRTRAEVHFNGLLAAVTLPANSAPPGTTVSVKADSESVAGSGQSERITLAFSHDVDFTAYPSFSLDVPQNINVDSPFQLDFYDGISAVPLRKISLAPAQAKAIAYASKLTFVGGFFTPFHAKAKELYYARLIQGSRSPARLRVSGTVQTVDLPQTSGAPGFVYTDVEGYYTKPQPVSEPATPGITASIEIKTLSRNAGSVSITTADKAPAGIPQLNGNDVQPMPYYIDLVVPNSVQFAAPFRVSLVLPLTGTFRHLAYNVAVYDAKHAEAGWQLAAAETSQRRGDVLRITLRPAEVSRLRASGRYVFALYAVAPKATTAGPSIAVLGDSLSVLTVLPQSPVRKPNWSCVTGFDGVENCEYTVDSTLSYPGVIAALTSGRLLNFARLDGSQTTAGKNAWTDNVVPQFPTDLNFVVFEAGRADMIYNPPTTHTSPRVAEIVKAIVARSPHVKIIFVGPICIGGLETDAWYNTERELAVKYGAFVDSRAIFTMCSTVLLAPDGLHGSPEGNRVIGTAIAEAINALWAKENHR